MDMDRLQTPGQTEGAKDMEQNDGIAAAGKTDGQGIRGPKAGGEPGAGPCQQVT